MSSVGETLRRERLTRKLDLEVISHELKISSRMLEFMEADQWEKLPGGVFAKAFVRQYAALLGLDGDAMAAQLQRNIEPPEFQPAEKASKPAVHPIEVPRVEEWNSVGDRGFRLSGSLPALALVVVVMLICSAVYAWMQRPRVVQGPASAAQTPVTQPPATQAPVQQPAAVAPPVQQPAATPPAVVASAPAPATTPAPAAAQPTPAEPENRPPGPVHIEVAADETVWILARVDGKYAYSGTLEANARRTFDATENIVLRLGNAGGVAITQNGKPIGPAGPKGQVRTLQFTTAGFQIVPPKPPDAPPDR